MQRWLVGGLAIVVLSGSLVLARPGTVVTKDGRTYEGEVTEQGDTIDIANVQGLPGPVDVKKANVASITYPDEVAKQVHDALKKLDAKDVKSRLELARTAIQFRAYEAARDALVEVVKVDPNNRDASDMMAQVQQHLPPPTTAPTATGPTSMPAVAPGTPEVPGTKPLEGSEAAKRTVTNSEVNAIRQKEWRGEDDPVKIQIDAKTKKKFIDQNPDITNTAEFSAMSVGQQASLILSKGKPEVLTGVVFQGDPSSIAEFKRTVNRIVLQGCGALSCHGGPKAGSFTLVGPGNNTAAIYTNFLVLQQYTTAKGPMIDRVNPDNSMLLNLMLPGNQTTTPHPAAGPAFRSLVKTKSDPRYAVLLNWIQSLNPVEPKYGIDLTKAPPAPTKGDAKP